MPTQDDAALSTLIELWEKYILPYVRYAGASDEIIEMPVFLTDAMGFKRDQKGVQDPNCSLLFAVDFKNALLHQGHVSALILLYAMGGKEYDSKRRYLTESVLQHAIQEIPAIASWEGQPWIEKLFTNQIDLEVLVPLMSFWNQPEPADLVFRSYQYILPLYLFLGDYIVCQSSHRYIQACHQALVVSLCYLGDPSWRDVLCDLTVSRKTFGNIVQAVDEQFYVREKPIIVRGKYINIRMKDRVPKQDAIIQSAKDRLSFGAYITLLSKYARYMLPIGNSLTLIKREMTRNFGIVQSSLFQYK